MNFHCRKSRIDWVWAVEKKQCRYHWVRSTRCDPLPGDASESAHVVDTQPPTKSAPRWKRRIVLKHPNLVPLLPTEGIWFQVAIGEISIIQKPKRYKDYYRICKNSAENPVFTTYHRFKLLFGSLAGESHLSVVEAVESHRNWGNLCDLGILFMCLSGRMLMRGNLLHILNMLMEFLNDFIIINVFRIRLIRGITKVVKI
jgi:hypothetical protein